MADENEDHKHIFGGVNANGSKSFGDGFRSEKTGTGSYKVTFDDKVPNKTDPNPGFKGKPSTVCTIYGSDPLLIRVTDVNDKFFTCETTNSSGTAQDSQFTFIAFGKNPDYTPE